MPDIPAGGAPGTAIRYALRPSASPVATYDVMSDGEVVSSVRTPEEALARLHSAT